MKAESEMSLEQLHTELLKLGCTLSVDTDDSLLVEGPSESLTQELAARVRVHKPKLLQLLRCARCRSTDVVDVPIHGGNSRRRDCAACGRFMGFPMWGPREINRSSVSAPIC